MIGESHELAFSEEPPIQTLRIARSNRSFEMADSTGVRITRFFKLFSEFFKGYKIFASNTLIFFLTGAFEQLVEVLSFKCPSDQTVAERYSMAFLIGPIIILFLLGIVVQKKTWFSFYGCCMRKELFPTPPKPKTGETQTKPTVEQNFNLSAIIPEALILPFGWLCFALIDGDYVACFCGATFDNDKERYNYIKSESTFAAWMIIIGVAIISFLVICGVRCCKKQTYLQKQYVTMCRAKEKELMLKYMEENIETIVPTRAAKFLDAHNFTDKDWVLLTRVEPIPEAEMTLAIKDKKIEAAISPTTPLQAWILYREKQGKVIPPTKKSTTEGTD